uniref:Uncharacterized protein n=1 Tax=Candidatus Kentrum sp. MB TaxID=2138164 RepID=A0A450X7Q3_9GAMM|nr:MAG: hypothetical protein BECKMB1821G_GA0114241_101231 [Candidatus Kentron sp. MB]VFK31475.1 MAG: hypothetical protein BECKMB1821I_GA0114274_10242 [Candidatus Kentron sp. MB]VFK75526.1 MAG: hypothetical protein BECKMB1821H_GA0114242_10251 [Candidatus Kentron sp. MB]
MSRYTSWDQFMMDVVDTADSTVNLKELFDLTSMEVVKIIVKILAAGWLIFHAVVLLLSLAFPSFIVALGSFSATPVGVVMLIIFGISMIKIMRLLYKNRQLPVAIKKVGDNNKDKYHFIRENRVNSRALLAQEIDSLMFKAVNELISLARNQAESLKAKALAKIFEKIYLGYSNPDVGDVVECATNLGKAALEVEKENFKEAASNKIKQLLSERGRTIAQG